MKNDLGHKPSRGSLKTLFIGMCEALQDRKGIAVQELVLKKELLKEQMNMKKMQLEAQLKLKEEELKMKKEDHKAKLTNADEQKDDCNDGADVAV
jgi:hypothetical protein